jgi:serine/threonine protein kinase
MTDLLLQDLIADQSTALVYEAKDNQTGETYAIKIPKVNCPEVSRELAVLQTVSHPAIIQVRELETLHGPALAMPFARGGDLFSWIQSTPIDEDTVKGIVFKILQALAYLHSHNIWHRDIKPENILVMDPSLSPECVVLADFGFARRFPNGVCDDEFCGSLHYAAPELLRGQPYTEKVDIWALGITMFACLTSALPFECDADEARKEILAGLPGLFERERLEVSEECRDLIDRMLAPNPANRPSAALALEHAWFKDLCECKQVEGEQDLCDRNQREMCEQAW